MIINIMIIIFKAIISPVSACNCLPQGLGALEQAGRRFYQLFPTFDIGLLKLSMSDSEVFLLFPTDDDLCQSSISDSDFFQLSISDSDFFGLRMEFCIMEPLPSKSCFVSSPCCSVLLPPPQLSPGRIVIWVLGRLYHFFIGNIIHCGETYFHPTPSTYPSG